MALRKDLIITIDGPSGAGKSTIAKKLSRKLGYTFVDTGAMYRGVAYAYNELLKKQQKTYPDNQDKKGAESANKKRKNETAITPEVLEHLPVTFQTAGETKVFLSGKDISELIRDPEISLLASALSRENTVRKYLSEQQRALGKNGGVVLEGRDTGSVVFPDAHIKFYLDASPEERAKRRHLELLSKGQNENLDKVRNEMDLRDRNDSERAIAPLVVPEGAIRVDTSGIDIEGVLCILLEHIEIKGSA